MRLPLLASSALLIASFAPQASAADSLPTPAGASTPVASAPASPVDAHRAEVRDLLRLQGAFGTMQTWFLEARASFEASKPGIPDDLLDNFWQESLASFDLPARELAVLDACSATMSPDETRASLAFLRSDDMTLVRQLMLGASDQVQAAASAFMREVEQNCCEPSPTDFLLISRVKAPSLKLEDEQRMRLDAIFQFLDVGPRARLERMLMDEARARYPEASGPFWVQENINRVVMAHAEDMDRAMASTFVGHEERLANSLASPAAQAHRLRWAQMKAVLDAQGAAFVADLVNHSRRLAQERGPALAGH